MNGAIHFFCYKDNYLPGYLGKSGYLNLKPYHYSPMTQFTDVCQSAVCFLTPSKRLNRLSRNLVDRFSLVCRRFYRYKIKIRMRPIVCWKTELQIVLICPNAHLSLPCSGANQKCYWVLYRTTQNKERFMIESTNGNSFLVARPLV